MNLVPNTVVTLVGASYVGKTYFANQLKEYLLTQSVTCKIISSDEIRRDLLSLGHDTEIGDADAKLVSEVAFSKLESDLANYLKTPVNVDIVIIDSSGFNLQFRERIAEIAKDHMYSNVAVLFDRQKEIVKGFLTEDQVTQYNLHNNKLRKFIIPKFNRHSYTSVVKINKQLKYNFSYTDTSKILHLDSKVRYGFIGDIHGCIDELKSLVEKMKEKGIYNFVINGDFIDKSNKENIYQTLAYIQENVNNGTFKIIKGNHEAFVYSYFNGSNKTKHDSEIMNCFNTVECFNGNSEEDILHKSIFFDLYENHCYDYAVLKHGDKVTYISHAPCYAKSLGKKSGINLRNMRNYRIKRGDDISIFDEIKGIMEEKNNFRHIFGHVEIGKENHIYGNHIAIDQGCVSGGHLTCAYLNSKNFFDFEYVQNQEVCNEIPPFKKGDASERKLIDMTIEQERKHRRLMKVKPMFISTTVSPSPSKGAVLESVNNAVDYLKGKGITNIIAQKKHMGSRCQLYLFPDLENCYAISRNGNKIKIATPDIIKPMHEKYKDNIKELLVLDTELMSWSAMAGKMIDRSFKSYSQAVHSELSLLSNTNMEKLLEIDTNTQSQLIEKYDKQLDFFSKEADVYFEVFDVIYHDGKKFAYENKSYLTQYNISYESFNLNDNQDIVCLKEMYDLVVGDGFEGLMLKPLTLEKNMIPMMKVRNEEYLRIIYGHDYTLDIEKHCATKRITNKVSTSIKEMDLNEKLMEAWVNKDNDALYHVYHAFIVEMEKEVTLDPKL